MRAATFNVTIIHVYAPIFGHDDNKVDNFYQQLQEITDQTHEKAILILQGDWSAIVGKDVQADSGDICGPYCKA